jgi:nucleotide-binding universal stress UspA family protein
MYTKILLATDGSDNANRAAERVIEFQKKWDSKVVAFHSIEHHMIPKAIPFAIPMLPGQTYPIPTVDYEKILKKYEKAGEKILTETKKMFDDAGMPVETRLIENEKPEDYILNILEKEYFDLIVLGSKGHSTLERIFTGSVTQEVLNNTYCDLLVVR